MIRQTGSGRRVSPRPLRQFTGGPCPGSETQTSPNPVSDQNALSVRECLILLAVAVTWGANTLLSKIALDSVPPLAFLTARFGLTLVLAGWLLRPLRGARWPMLLLIALLTGPVHFGLQFIGIARAVDLSPMVIAMQLWIPFSVLFAALALKEVIAPIRLAGIAISFAGVLVLAFEPSVFAQLDALALVAAAAASYAAASVLMARTGGLDPVQTQLWVAIASIPVLAGASGLTETGQVEALLSAPPIVTVALVVAALFSGLLANSAMWRIIQRHPVSSVTPWLQVSPVVAVVLGVVVLDDPLTIQLVAGVVLSLAGVFVVAMARQA